MTRKSGVPGKTVRALYRAQDAATRQVLRQQRTPQQQCELLDTRRGESRKERLRLGYVILATDPEIVPRRATEPPKRHRRRAVRRAQKSVTIKGRAKA